MKAEDQHLMTLFEAALDCESESERIAFLDRECAVDATLRARVEALIRAHDGAGRFLEPDSLTASTDSTTAAMPDGQREGTLLAGRYKLLELVGEGGMGTVWSAQQLDPVKRLVAVKLIKPGMDSRQVLARFEAERQALAIMDHPNIARVYDGGATPEGHPYFVMELVKGVPITKYCDERHLTTRQRLELFVPVCHAIQHAHQKGIIHRDIKPSNVIIATYDDRPIPKVIDFGIAKATGAMLTDMTLITGLGTVVGTLEYMSPEQAELSNLDVDTRSDVYSLGAVLYELLAGSTPFSRKELEEFGVYEMLRVIREKEPSKPSTKLGSAAKLPALAANRGTEPRQLTRQMRGDLDWIVMKSLEKDRSRRYETANSLAMDVQRYLQDQPIEACPPSAVYRFRKFARRNRAALGVAIFVVVCLLLGVAGLIISNVRISHEKEEKDKALTEAKINYEESKKQEKIAQENAANAETQRGIAVNNEKSAKAHELLARRRFNAAQMNLAMQAWHAGEVPRVLELLESQRPRADQEDLRGFEWYYLWRLCNSGRRHLLIGPKSAVSALAFSPDGKTLASATWDRRVQLWDTDTGKLRAVLQGHQDFAWEIVFSPNGKMLASGGKETSTLIVWDALSGKKLHAIPGRVEGIAFSPDNRTLAGGAITNDGIHAKVWDVATGAARSSIDQAGVVLGYLPDGETLVTRTVKQPTPPGSGIVLWDLKTKAPRLRIPVSNIRGAALSADGSTVATTIHSLGDPIRLWNTNTGKEVAALSGHGGIKRTLAFSKDGKKLASGSNDRTAIVWDLLTGRPIGQEVHLDPLSAVAFSPDNLTLASATFGGAIKLWDMASPVDAINFAASTEIVSMTFSPKGQNVILGGRNSTRIVDAKTGKELASLPLKEVQAISGDATSMAALGPDNTTTIWDRRTERAATTLPTGPIKIAAFSPDGLFLASFGSRDVNMKLWDLSTAQSRTFNIEPPVSNRQFVNCTAFSADGRFVAAGFTFQWITVWEVATGKVKLQFSQGPALMNVLSVAFSPDSQSLAVGTDVGAVTLWEVETGKLLKSFKGHTLPVRSLAFSPDGKTLATACADKTFRLWDVATGQERITIKGHATEVVRVAFAPDGNSMATASVDGTIKIWQGATSAEARAFKSENDSTDPESLSAQLHAARVLASAGRLDVAFTAYQQLLARLKKLHMGMPNAGYDRELLAVQLETARLLVSMERWTEAAAEFAKVHELVPDDLESIFDYAAILLLIGNGDGYRQLCAQLLQRAKNLQCGNLPGRKEYLLARILLMTSVNANESLRLAEEAVKAEPSVHHLHTLGLAYYRMGRLEDAAIHLQKSMKADPNWPAHSASKLVQAMAHNRSGQLSEAQKLLEHAAQLVDTDRANPERKSVTGLGMHPHDWIAWLVLRREAETLIRTGK